MRNYFAHETLRELIAAAVAVVPGYAGASIQLWERDGNTYCVNVVRQDVYHPVFVKSSLTDAAIVLEVVKALPKV